MKGKKEERKEGREERRNVSSILYLPMVCSFDMKQRADRTQYSKSIYGISRDRTVINSYPRL